MELHILTDCTLIHSDAQIRSGSRIWWVRTCFLQHAAKLTAYPLWGFCEASQVADEKGCQWVPRLQEDPEGPGCSENLLPL